MRDNGVYFAVANAQTSRQVLVALHTGDMHAPWLDRRKVCSLMTQKFAGAITEGREPLTGAAAGTPLHSLIEVAERSPGAGIRL